MGTEKSLQKTSAKGNQVSTGYDRIYRVEELAEELGVSKRTLAEKFRDGQIRAYKKMGKWYTLHSDLVAYLKE